MLICDIGCWIVRLVSFWFDKIDPKAMIQLVDFVLHFRVSGVLVTSVFSVPSSVKS